MSLKKNVSEVKTAARKITLLILVESTPSYTFSVVILPFGVDLYIKLLYRHGR